MALEGDVYVSVGGGGGSVTWLVRESLKGQVAVGINSCGTPGIVAVWRQEGRPSADPHDLWRLGRHWVATH